MRYIFKNQVHKRFIENLIKEANKTKQTSYFTIEEIETYQACENLKRLLVKFGIDKKIITSGSKENRKKMFSSKNIIKRATMRAVDLKEYYIKFQVTKT